jgi:hypothetical protein
LGIDEQDRFLCETVDVDGKTRVDLRKIPDKEVSDEELKAIQESIDKALPRDDPGIEY